MNTQNTQNRQSAILGILNAYGNLDVNQIELLILQAYSIPWTPVHLDQLKNIIVNLNDPMYSQYKNSAQYRHHDFLDQNTVPCLEYQTEVAKYVSNLVDPIFLPRVEKIQMLLFDK